MSWRRPSWLCGHEIDEVYEVYGEELVVEDEIAALGRVDYVGHCQRCDRDVRWSENI